MIGVNSRLDSLQAAILEVKLKHLDNYCKARQEVAEKYDKAFINIKEIQTPVREKNSTHVFHQYTLLIKNGERDRLQEYLREKGVPSMIYYPVPLYKQDAFKTYVNADFVLPVTERLCDQVLSLPIHTEMDTKTQNYIIQSVKEFINQ